MGKDLKKKYFDWNLEFKGLRRFYQLASALFQNFHFMLKWLLKRHDLLASDRNINPDNWNDHIMIFRNSYKVAFETWCKEYMYTPRNYTSKNKPIRSKDEHYDDMYNEVSQKSLRFLLDFISTMALEDTVYRELLAMWMFEMQFQMNAKFNPEVENHHVIYCNYMRNDKDYYGVLSQIKKRMYAQQKHHQELSGIQQTMYGNSRMKVERDKAKDKFKSLDKYLKGLKKKEKVKKK